MGGRSDAQSRAVTIADIEAMESELRERREKLLADLQAIGGALQALKQLKEKAHE